MSKLFKKLKAGLKDVIAHKQGKLHMHSISLEVPEPPVKDKSTEPKKRREAK